MSRKEEEEKTLQRHIPQLRQRSFHRADGQEIEHGRSFIQSQKGGRFPIVEGADAAAAEAKAACSEVDPLPQADSHGITTDQEGNGAHKLLFSACSTILNVLQSFSKK